MIRRHVADADAVHGHRALAHARRRRRRRPAGAARGHPPAQPGRGRGGEPGRAATTCSTGWPPIPPSRGVPAAALRAELEPARYTGRAAPPGRRVPRRVPAPAARARAPARGRGRRRRRCGYDARSPRAGCRFPLLRRGKVREVYEVDADHLLLVASDRVSAFDVVMREPIPRKGAVLTQISAFWFERLADGVPVALRHRAHRRDPRRAFPRSRRTRREIAGRAMLVRRTAPVPFECVVRGYLSGSAWAEYREPRHARRRAAAGRPASRATGSIRRSSRPPPRRRPATTRTSPSTRVAEALGPRRWPAGCGTRASRSIAPGATTPPRRGIIIADTKFEFGTDADGTLRLIDEVLTPDCSRFWPADRYAPGRTQPSFDKQPLRDYLAGAQGARAAGTARRRRRRCRPRWSRPPAARYLEAFRLLTGRDAGGRRRDPHRAGGALVHRRRLGRSRWRCSVAAARRWRRRVVDRRRRSGPCWRSGSSPSSAIPSGPGPRGDRLIVAPADGKVVSVIEVDEPASSAAARMRISIFMNVFDCHVNRYPTDGTVAYRHYNPGKFGHAGGGEVEPRRTSSPRSGSRHARGKVLIRQIAGLVARRIVTDHEVGTAVHQGERHGHDPLRLAGGPLPPAGHPRPGARRATRPGWG